MGDFPLEVICQKDAGRIYECQVLKARVTELESALAKSASREAALVEKLKVATCAMENLVKVKGRFHTALAYDGIVAALAKIKEAS